ncbi:MAG: DNA adenine methylase [Prevotella sp.]|nr:DNA adenine methylase [Prevotella sp.]
MKQTYTQAPLPFMGQKRRWSTDFKTAVLNHFNDCDTFIDLFGGSGLLSYFTKNIRPDATVVYNDYDGYTERLAHIEDTNRLLRSLRSILAFCPTDKRINDPERSKVLTLLNDAEADGIFVDYITLSNSLLFSGKYATNYEQMAAETLYNRVRTADFQAEGYLDGLRIEHCDYRILLNRYCNIPGVCFVADPPYLSTQVTPYKGYWRLTDYLDVLTLLSGTNYIYFTSTKSGLIELCNWIGRQAGTALNPLDRAEQVSRKTSLNYNAAYTEIMLYKHHSDNQNSFAA